MRLKEVLFMDEAIEDIIYWCKTDSAVLLKIIELIASIRKTPFEGIGNPEMLKLNFSG